MQPLKTSFVTSFILFGFLFIFSFKNQKIEINGRDISFFNSYDVIITCGQSFYSRLININNFSLDNYSHIGILICENNKIFVLHSTPDGTKENGIRYDEIQKFIDLSDVNKYTVLRLSNLNQTEKEILSEEISRLRHLNVPFDYDFNNRDQSQIYCSELVWLIYKKVSPLFLNGFEIDKPIHPKKFLEQDFFHIIVTRFTN